MSYPGMENQIYVVAFLTGIFLHAVIFSRYEWDRHTPSIVLSTYAFYATTLALLSIVGGFSFGQFFVKALILGVAFLVGLCGSMVIYRLFLHPLKSIPGPLAARVTSLWMVRENIPDLNFYVKLRSLHDQYGDFIRVRKWRFAMWSPRLNYLRTSRGLDLPSRCGSRYTWI
jgi:hypothetical protein